jgi:hypothetical protein
MSLEPGDGALHFFIRGLRVSRLLDLREVCGPKTLKTRYSNGQGKTRKTEIGASEPRRLREQQKNSRNDGRMESWKNGRTGLRMTEDRMNARCWILDAGNKGEEKG